jgi:hypothetical protein
MQLSLKYLDFFEPTLQTSGSRHNNKMALSRRTLRCTRSQYDRRQMNWFYSNFINHTKFVFINKPYYTSTSYQLTRIGTYGTFMFAFIPRSILVRKLVTSPSRKLDRHLRTVRSVYSLVPGVIKRWNWYSWAVRSSLLVLSPQTLSLQHMTRCDDTTPYTSHTARQRASNIASRCVFDSGYQHRQCCIRLLQVRSHPCAPHILQSLVQSWRTVLRVSALNVHELRRFFSRALGNFEEQNKALEPSIIIINRWIIINAHHNYIV